MGAALHRPLAQSSHAVSVRVKRLGCIARAVGMEQPTLFHRQEKDKPVDHSQQLVEIVLQRQRTVLQLGTKSLVLGVREEALT